jgi:hypothetical protein
VSLLFAQPHSNGREITVYQVQIYSYQDDEWVENTAVCDGSSQNFIDQLQCDVDMLTFISTYGYLRS